MLPVYDHCLPTVVPGHKLEIFNQAHNQTNQSIQSSFPAQILPCLVSEDYLRKLAISFERNSTKQNCVYSPTYSSIASSASGKIALK